MEKNGKASSTIRRESQLRHPLELPVFSFSVIVNMIVMAAAILIVERGGDWLAAHALLAKHIDEIRAGAIAAIIATPAVGLIRHTRRAFIRGNSVRLSKHQFPQVHGILEQHCRKLAIDQLPELYLTDWAISEPAHAFSVWGTDYIVLRTDFLESPIQNVRDVLAFTLGCELGRLRLGHTAWWDEVLLTYVRKIPYLKTPISRVRTYSRDRYGAFLAPEGIRALVALAAGRRMLSEVNVAEFLRQAGDFGGLWARLASFSQTMPSVCYRIQALYVAGLFSLDNDLRRLDSYRSIGHDSEGHLAEGAHSEG